MPEKKYLVPEGMLRAAERAYNDCISEDNRSEETVEAALRWLAENPIVPTAKKSAELEILCKLNDEPTCSDAIFYCSEWQRRMFLRREK